MDDQELNRLLREWRAPDAPPNLRPPRAHVSRLRWLVSGTIPVPVPVAFAALVLLALWMASTRLAPTPTQDASAPRRSGEIARYALTGALEGFDAVLIELGFRRACLACLRARRARSSRSWTAANRVGIARF